jgi:hypothetical protein
MDLVMQPPDLGRTGARPDHDVATKEQPCAVLEKKPNDSVALLPVISSPSPQSTRAGQTQARRALGVRDIERVGVVQRGQVPEREREAWQQRFQLADSAVSSSVVSRCLFIRRRRCQGTTVGVQLQQELHQLRAALDDGAVQHSLLGAVGRRNRCVSALNDESDGLFELAVHGSHEHVHCEVSPLVGGDEVVVVQEDLQHVHAAALQRLHQRRHAVRVLDIDLPPSRDQQVGHEQIALVDALVQRRLAVLSSSSDSREP